MANGRVRGSAGNRPQLLGPHPSPVRAHTLGTPRSGGEHAWSTTEAASRGGNDPEAPCDLGVKPGEEVEGCDSGAKRERGPWHPRARRAQKASRGYRVGAGLSGELGAPALLGGRQPPRRSCAGRTVAGGPRGTSPPASWGREGPNPQPSLAHFSNKRKRLEYWSLGTKNQAAIIHPFCAFLSRTHLPFSQADPSAFLPRI